MIHLESRGNNHKAPGETWAGPLGPGVAAGPAAWGASRSIKSPVGKRGAGTFDLKKDSMFGIIFTVRVSVWLAENPLNFKFQISFPFRMFTLFPLIFALFRTRKNRSGWDHLT